MTKSISPPPAIRLYRRLRRAAAEARRMVAEERAGLLRRGRYATAQRQAGARLEAHYDKEFPIKRLGTNLWAALDYTLFHEGRPGVVIGKDGWLFTDEEFKPAPSGQQLEDNWALVRGVRRS
ncbi:alginate O-acetyltransferase AlgX-related protein [Pseudomonas aeruginosa]